MIFEVCFKTTGGGGGEGGVRPAKTRKILQNVEFCPAKKLASMKLVSSLSTQYHLIVFDHEDMYT